MWENAKPKTILTEFLTDLFQRLKIGRNFESIEINIMAEFHLFNLIFAIQELDLDYTHASYLLNLFWVLLINCTEEYGIISHNHKDVVVRESNIIMKVDKEKENTEPLKNINKDLEVFKFWVRRCSFNNPPSCLPLFTPK